MRCIRPLREAVRLLRELNRKVDHLMAQQDDINAYAQAISTAVDGIAQDIADLKAANPALDLSALQASVDRLTALDAENPAPVEPPA